MAHPTDTSSKPSAIPELPLGWRVAEPYLDPRSENADWNWIPRGISRERFMQMSGIDTQTACGTPMYSDDRDRDY